MSLNWSTVNCPRGPEPVDDNDAIGRENIVFATMAVGINKLDDPKEFYIRWCMHLRFSGRDSEAITYEDCVRWEGLTTNAETLTRAKFRNAIAKTAEQEVVYRANRKVKLIEDNTKEKA